MSRIGKKTISLPEKVSVKEANGHVTVEGPKGKLEFTLPEGITLSQEDTTISVDQDLEIQGVGFRAKVAGKALDLSLGKSHPILHPIPEGLTVTVTENTKIKVEGIDKQVVGQFAAEVRGYYPPEPYKGKGVRYVGEYVRRKAGKSVGK